MSPRALAILVPLLLAGCGETSVTVTGPPPSADTPSYQATKGGSLPPAQLPAVSEPEAGPSSSYLVDSSIPAYGTPDEVPHITDSRVRVLYVEIHQYLSAIEARILADLPPPPPPVDPSKAPPSEEAQLKGFLAALSKLDHQLRYRNFAEQWQIDNSFSDLHRANDMLHQSGRVSEATFHTVDVAKPVPVTPGPTAAPAGTAAPASAPAGPAAPTADAKAAAPAAPAADAKASTPAAPATDANAAAPAAPAAPATDANAAAPAAPAAPAADANAAAPAAPAAAPADSNTAPAK